MSRHPGLQLAGAAVEARRSLETAAAPAAAPARAPGAAPEQLPTAAHPGQDRPAPTLAGYDDLLTAQHDTALTTAVTA
jgi:hypothetical protein